jgi:hypothetical protein
LADTIPMTHLDTGKTADVHPNEVENMKAHGWREAAPASLPPPPAPPPSAPAKPQLGLPKRKD